MERIIEPAVEFLKGLKNRKVAVIFGHDADSISSAVLMYKLLEKLYAKPILVIAEENFTITPVTVKKLKKLKPSHIILVDLADISISLMDELANIGEVLNIDHHVPKGYDNIVYVNPRLHDRHAYIPVSYLCYKIYRKFSSDELMWIAAIGTLGDHGMKNCLDLFQEIKRNYPELIGKSGLIDEKLYENSLIGKLVRIVDSGRVVVGAKGSMKTAEVLIDAKTYRDVLDNKQLEKWYEIAEKEFARIVSDFWKNKKVLNDVVFYEIKSKYQFKSAVAGYLQQSVDNKIIAVGQQDDRMLDVSLRRGIKVDTDLSELAMSIAADIPGSTGGGHEAASAVRVPLNKKKRLLELLSSRKKA